MTTWIKPDTEAFKHEHHVECVLKGMTFNGKWSEFSDFEADALKGEAVEIDKETDRQISYRSHTRSQEQLLNLLRSYRSWGTFRTEETVQHMYDGFDRRDAMPMPIVLRFKNGSMRVLGGNTRMDVAFQKGINPVVWMVDAPV